MPRIQKAYENKFRAILGSVNPRQFEKAMQWFRGQAEQRKSEKRMTPDEAWGEVYEEGRRRLEKWRQAHKRTPKGIAFQDYEAVRFFCDAGLGGLARWLRAAGYETYWSADIEDNALLAEAQRLSAVLLTTDSMLLERRLLRDGVIRSLWVSPALKTKEQLAAVLRELALTLRTPRCMTCGGELGPGDKEALRERIPPKTYRWLDEYFVCATCGKLFWHGTHWGEDPARNSRRLERGPRQAN